MDPAVWGMIAVVVLGTAVVAWGWARDRRRVAAALRQASESPPARGGVPQDRPDYVLDAEILASLPQPTIQDADDLLDRLQGSPTLPAGAAEASFLNLNEKGLAALADPSVIVCSNALTTDREVNALLIAAKRRGRPVVIVAPGFGPGVLGTLRANATRGTLPNLPIPLAEPVALRRAVALTGGRLVEGADLTAGWLPGPAWGTCDGWLADLDTSWVLVAGREAEDSQSTV